MTSLRRPRVLWFSVVMILALASASMAQGTGTVLNRANFGIPSQSLFAVNGTRLADAGRITTLASAPRQAQIGVKFVW